MSVDRTATSERMPFAAVARRLLVSLGGMALPAVLGASGDSDALRTLAERPLITIMAESAEGSARLELRPSDYTIDQGVLRWSSAEPRALRDLVTGHEIARLEQVSVHYVADPLVGLAVEVSAGPFPTVFTVSSGVLGFAGIADAQGRASAGFTITDKNGDGVALTGLNPDAQSFQAFYNHPVGDGTASTFATLASGFSAAAPYTSGSGVDEFPAAAGLSATTESGVLLGTVSSMSTEVHFGLSALDSASATAVFVIQSVDSPLAATLEATSAAGSAELRFELPSVRSESGKRTWRTAGPAVLVDPATGVALGSLEAEAVLVADHTLALGFAVTGGGGPTNFTFTFGAPPFPAVPNAFARASAAVTITDFLGSGATLTGNNADGQAYETFYNDIGGVPATGATFATLVDGLSVPIAQSTVGSVSELGAAGAFTATAEGGAALGSVTSMSLRWEFTLTANDIAGGTSIYAIHPGGTAGGRVYEDVDGDGTQDPGEPGLEGVDVVITDSQAGIWTVTTDANGDYARDVPAGSTSIDIDDSTLPPGAVQTEGTDPTVVQVPEGSGVSDVDGYQLPPPPSVLEIPALDFTGLALLVVGLGLAGALVLMRRSARNWRR